MTQPKAPSAPGVVTGEAAEAIEASLRAGGPEKVLATDIPRLWATGAQAFLNSQYALLIFREQNLFTDPGQEPTALIKNVASLIMPIDILREFHKNLGEALQAFDSNVQ